MEPQANAIQNYSRILLLAAMDTEESAICARLPVPRTSTLSSRHAIMQKIFTQGSRSITLVRTGIGLVQAALATALALESQEFSAVLLLGVAGALDPKLQIGDAVLATEILQHDSIFSGPNGNERMAPGSPYVSIPATERMAPLFSLDEKFRRGLAALLAGENIHEGLLLSGNEFVGTPARKLELAHNFPGALAVEMESAGIAQVLRNSGIPFAALKTIADRIQPDHSVATDYTVFLQQSAAHAARCAERIWQAWAEQAPNSRGLV